MPLSRVHLFHYFNTLSAQQFCLRRLKTQRNTVLRWLEFQTPLAAKGIHVKSKKNIRWKFFGFVAVDDCFACLVWFQYCTIAVYLNVTQLTELNACWNMVYRKIFGFHKWESVKLLIADLGRLDFIHIRVWFCMKFCKRVINSSNQIINACCWVYYLGCEFNQLCRSFDVDVNLLYSVIRRNIFTGLAPWLVCDFSVIVQLVYHIYIISVCDGFY